jgi:Holliday junction resolvase RusA-like endonuclease
MTTLQIKVESDVVEIEHDGYSTIIIYGEPINESIDYDPQERARGLEYTNAMDTLQSIDMMDFEANIAMLLRAILKDQQQPVPLHTGIYSIEIEVASSRTTLELPLIGVIKSVIDGVNKEIVGNDVTVYEATIRYTKAKVRSRGASTRPADELTVSIYAIDGGIKHFVVGFDRAPLHVVPKVKPSLLDDEQQSLWWVYNEELQEQVATALDSDGMQIPIGGAKEVSMTFTDNLVSKVDIDNMARAVYPILNKLGVSDGDVHSIHLVKQLQPKGQRNNVTIVVQ